MVRKLKITKEITLDVSRLNRFQSIIAKQNDKDSRYLKVSVAEEGNVLIIPSSAKVTITATRPDKLSSSFLGKISEDGKAIVPLSPWMLELDGSLSCEVSIITEESVLKTTSFSVDVEPDESSGNTDVTQDPNYDILVELIQEVAGIAATEDEAIAKAVDAYLEKVDKTEIIAELAENETFIDNVSEIVKTEVPLVKVAEQPTFVDSVDEMTDTSQYYVLSTDGFFYGYKEKENYNLFKISEVSFSSRLQADAEGIISSTAQQAVTGWIPVKYGKFYTMSMLYNGTRISHRANTSYLPYRMNGKKADGTVVVWNTDIHLVDNRGVITMPSEDIVGIQIQFNLNNITQQNIDISAEAKIKVYEIMFVEGNTVDEAYNKAINLEYVDGDAEAVAEWYNTGLAYNQPADYEQRIVDLESDVEGLKNTQSSDLEKRVANIENWDKYLTYEAQRRISYDWRIPFVDVFNKLGLGSKHIIPNTYDIWGGTGNDLTQKEIMMEDGMHPSTGDGVTMMYAQAVIPQLKAIPPLYSADSENDDWTGKSFLWMGTSVSAGSDPALGVEGIGTTYPAIVANTLGASCDNIARGSSCVRINASTGKYTNMAYHHFLRSMTRTVAEADLIQSDWDNIKGNITGAASAISSDDLTIMKAHSFENLLLPYLNGTKSMPDLFVIDHGHNDRRPYGIDGEQDLLVKPTVENIANGTLAEDSYMTANNYANLKIAFNNDLNKIPDLASFAASVNRNCFIGAMNFLITLIYRHNPKARIAIVSDYD